MNKIQKEKILKYNVIFQAEPEGGYTVTVPTLRGCVTHGRTLKEAREMAKEAIQVYVESLVDDGLEVPTDENSFFSSLNFGMGNFKIAHA